MAKPWHQRQKEKGVKLILTWFGARNCWKKYHGGEVWYFKYPDSAEGYETAVLEFHRRLDTRKGSRPLVGEFQHHIQILQKSIEWYDRFGVPSDEVALRDEVEAVLERLKASFVKDALPRPETCLPDGTTEAERQFIVMFCESGILDPNEVSSVFCQKFGSIAWVSGAAWKERFRQLDSVSSHQSKHPQTVGHQVQRFLKFKEKQVEGGVVTARTWGTLNERLEKFVTWIKPGTHVSTIDGTTLTGFYEWLLSQKNWGQLRRKGVFTVARQWIRWAWRQDDVELEVLPRNINSDEFVFLAHLDESGVTRKSRTDLLWSVDVFHEVLNLMPDDFKLYLILMLNCGFTNSDLTKLAKSEVRLDEGRIVRQRTKTRRHRHPPVVNYVLWTRTLDLLRSHWSDHPSLVLTNRAGNPLGVSKLVQDGDQTKETVWTSIGRRFELLKKKHTNMPQKQLMFLRKTGSTKIKSDMRYMTLDSLYLGHSWANIADKHYNAFDGQPYAPLDEAIRWLGSEFKIL